MNSKKEVKNEIANYESIAKALIEKNGLKPEPSSKVRLKLLAIEAATNGIIHHDKSEIIEFFKARIGAICESAKRRGASTIGLLDLAAIDQVQFQCTLNT